MKKTVKINLSGIVFHLDEDAFYTLENYLNTIKRHFGTNPEGSEIITDIEHRVAELLQLKLNEQKQVITENDIQEIMNIMGKPEDIFTDEDATDDGPTMQTSRRFYRDIDHNVAGGVCSGLGAHFNIDPVILRVLFIVLAIPLAAFPVVLYIVLWVVIPAAVTPQQKMDMRGGNYTISDIENSVKNEYDKVRTNWRSYRDSERYQRTRENLNTAGNGLIELFGFVGKLIVSIIGIALILSGIGLIASMFGVFVFSDSFLFWTHSDQHHLFIPDFLLSMVHPKSVLLATICLFIAVSAPIIAIIYWGLKLTLRFRSNDKIISLVGAVAWILSIVILLGITMFEARGYAFSTSLDDSIEMDLPDNQTLYIKSNAHMNEFSEIYFFEEGLEVYSHNDYPDRLYMEPKFRIKYTSNSNISIEFEREARGATNRDARENAQNIEFNWNLIDSVLYIDPLFYLKDKEKWTFPELDVVLYLPEGRKICIDRNLEQTISYARTVGNISYYEIPGKCWIMTERGLDYPD